MSLVAYASSSSSDSEASESETDGEHEFREVDFSKIDKSKFAGQNLTDICTQLFFNLPPPVKSTQLATIVEEDDEFLLKKETPDLEERTKPKSTVKIGIPSVSEYDESDDEEPAEKKLKLQTSAQKNSGLFLLLPPPKVKSATTNKSFIPHVLQKTGNKLSSKKGAKTSKPIEKKECKVELKQNKESETSLKPEEHDSDDSLDAFPENFDDETWQKVCGKATTSAKKKIADTAIENEQISAPVVDLAPEAVKPYSGLSNQAFKELVGSSKRKAPNIEFVDIHEDEIRPDREEWLKSLTDPNCPAKEKEASVDPVNDTCKRKHHITYLAHQAKANEQELQTQWSQSRFNRKQTQAKYGF